MTSPMWSENDAGGVFPWVYLPCFPATPCAPALVLRVWLACLACRGWLFAGMAAAARCCRRGSGCWLPCPARCPACAGRSPACCLQRSCSRSVWDLRTGAVARSLESTGAVTSIEVTPCGRYIVTADGKQVRACTPLAWRGVCRGGLCCAMPACRPLLARHSHALFCCTALAAPPAGGLPGCRQLRPAEEPRMPGLPSRVGQLCAGEGQVSWKGAHDTGAAGGAGTRCVARCCSGAFWCSS